MKNTGLKIRSLPRDDFLFASGLRPRDRIISVNGCDVVDELGFFYRCASDFLEEAFQSQYYISSFFGLVNMVTMRIKKTSPSRVFKEIWRFPLAGYILVFLLNFHQTLTPEDALEYRKGFGSGRDYFGSDSDCCYRTTRHSSIVAKFDEAEVGFLFEDGDHGEITNSWRLGNLFISGAPYRPNASRLDTPPAPLPKYTACRILRK